MFCFQTVLLTCSLALGASATRDAAFLKHVNSRTAPRDAASSLPSGAFSEQVPQMSGASYLNSRSKKFAVNGTKLPEVSFDVGESYAGLLPISDKHNESRQLYFWFFPSDAKDASEEIVVWLNGGPGCSSLSGLLTENGPFLWQDGTLSPVPNPYSWSKLSNIVWIEQPVGTGFSRGEPNISDEIALAEQFKGFWKNFVDTFGLDNRKIYITGESYAGMYAPYIAASFLDANDTKYFNLKGVAINDPVIGDGTLQEELPTVTYATYWANLLGLDKTTVAKLQRAYKTTGYEAYVEKYFKFPPPPHPWEEPPRYDGAVDETFSEAVYDANPCFNTYHISDQCPDVYAHLGVVNPGDYEPPGGQVYFQRKDVQKAINAPLIGEEWEQCGGPVFVNGDDSPGPALDGTLAHIVAKTKNLIIGSGALDNLLPTNGTLFALQNTTWGGKQGFHEYPSTPFFVPKHNVSFNGFAGGNGNLGIWREERGLTFYEITLAGHELPGYTPSAGYRLLQKLLGRIKDFSSTAPLF